MKKQPNHKTKHKDVPLYMKPNIQIQWMYEANKSGQVRDRTANKSKDIIGYRPM